MSTKIEKKVFRKTTAASLLFVHFTHIRNMFILVMILSVYT